MCVLRLFVPSIIIYMETDYLLLIRLNDINVGIRDVQGQMSIRDVQGLGIEDLGVHSNDCVGVHSDDCVMFTPSL